MRVGVDQSAVHERRERYRNGGVDALADEPRTGVPRTIGDNAIEALVVKILTQSPRDARHSSTRDMAKATGMSQPNVRRIWKASGLKSWATDTFKLSEDPFFIKQVRDVVGLYMNLVQHVPVGTGLEFDPIDLSESSRLEMGASRGRSRGTGWRPFGLAGRRSEEPEGERSRRWRCIGSTSSSSP